MKVLLLEPEKAAREVEIGNDLASMQKAVGGFIEAVYPYDDRVAIVCNEEGKIMRLPPNRALRDDTGEIYDILVGTCFICGLGEENFASLSPQLMQKYKEKFRYPELIASINGTIMAKKVPENFFHKDNKSNERIAPDIERR